MGTSLLLKSLLEIISQGTGAHFLNMPFYGHFIRETGESLAASTHRLVALFKFIDLRSLDTDRDNRYPSALAKRWTTHWISAGFKWNRLYFGEREASGDLLVLFDHLVPMLLQEFVSFAQQAQQLFEAKTLWVQIKDWMWFVSCHPVFSVTWFQQAGVCSCLFTLF